MQDNNQDKILIKGGYYEFPLKPVKRRIKSGKWGTRMPSARSAQTASKEDK